MVSSHRRRKNICCLTRHYGNTAPWYQPMFVNLRKRISLIIAMLYSPGIVARAAAPRREMSTFGRRLVTADNHHRQAFSTRIVWRHDRMRRSE